MAQEISRRGNQGGNLAHRREHPLQQLRRELDSLFSPFFGGGLDRDFEPMRVWDFDVKENDKEITVRADMPGFDEDELDVQINDNVLTIRAEKEQKSDGREEYRSFYRSLALPSGIDSEKVQATYRNGVLEMHIPRSEGARPKRIQIGGQQGAIGQKEGTQSQQQGMMDQKAEATSGSGSQPSQGGQKSNPAETKTTEKAQK